MRSMWKGAVSFGLVTIPVKMYSATEEKDVSFHQVRRSDGSRVRYRRVAEADGEEVSYADIAKGYQLDNGETVILTDADFADLPLPTAHSLDVLQFVPLDQVDPIYFNKSYYLEPEKQAAKPYVLLREALARSGMAALVKVAIRTREQLATMRVRDDVIVLETMLWPDEIRTPDFAFLDENIELRKQEIAMADSLVASMTGDFEPSEFSDDYRVALMEVIDAKAAGREVVDAPGAPTSSAGSVVDLMAALRASVDAAKRNRGEAPALEGAGSAEGDGPAEGDGSTEPAAKTGPGRSAAKRAPATKTTATKTTATKTTASKATASKATATKTTANKAAASRSTVKSAGAKPAAQKATAGKATAGKATAAKATAAKATAGKATAAKATTTKGTAGKAATATATAGKAAAAPAVADKVAARRRSA